MKTFRLTLLALISIIFLQNCKKDKTTEETSLITGDDAKQVIITDTQTDDVLGLVDFYAFDDTSSRTYQLPSCVTQTIVHQGTSIVITWEFDPNGCLMPNGKTYRGTVTITRDRDPAGHVINGSATFDQLYIDDFMIDGSTDFVREINASGNPQVTHNFDLSFTFPNGDTASRSGTKTREWIAGFGTPSHGDDVFSVTGQAHLVKRNGEVIDAVVINPLRREVPCRYFVSGTMEITKNGQTAVLDFGNGNCDNEATLTLPDGTVRIIHL